VAEQQQQSPTPVSIEREVQEDVWLYRSQRVSKNIRWFAVSVVAHVLLLGLFATVSMTIAQKRHELIKIAKVQDLAPSLEEQERIKQAQAEEKKPEDWEGEPSLKDLPGVLTMEQLAPKKVSTPAGPPPEVGHVQAIKAPVMPVAPPPPAVRSLPVIGGLGPGVLEVNHSDGRESGVARFSNLNAIGALATRLVDLAGRVGIMLVASAKLASMWRWWSTRRTACSS
jgi:hypothetical protein